MIKKLFDNFVKKLTISNVMIILLILYIIPTFINYDFNTENRFTGVKISLPYIYDGDQPHYYIMVYSLLKDKDLDVGNNYDNSEFNLTYDIGYLFRGQHVFKEGGYYNFNTRNYTDLWIENTSENINTFGEIKVFEGENFFERGYPSDDYSIIMVKPWGMPLFYYIFLLPFGFLSNPEPLIIFLSVILVLIGTYYFFLILNHFLKDEKISALFTLFFGISSEIWTYSKLFYPDILHFFLLSLIVYLFIVKKNNLIPGILFAIGIFARPILIIVLPIFIIYRFFNLDKYASFSEVNWNISRLIDYNGFKKMFLLLSPIFLILMIQFYFNYYFFGGFFSNPNLEVFVIRNIFDGLLASFIRLDRGLFIFSPVLIFAFFGLKSFYKKYEIDSIFIYLIPLIFIIYFSWTLISWNGTGDTYSMRHYVPIVSYFFIPMAFWYKEVTRTNRTIKKNKLWINLFYLALIISILINFQAAIFHALIWNGPPWKIISLAIENFL